MDQRKNVAMIWYVERTTVMFYNEPESSQWQSAVLNSMHQCIWGEPVAENSTLEI